MRYAARAVTTLLVLAWLPVILAKTALVILLTAVIQILKLWQE